MPIPRKTVPFEDGNTYDDVPVFINDLEGYKRFKDGAGSLEEPRTRIDPRDASEYGAGTRDVKRVFRSMVGIPSEFAESIIPLDAEELDIIADRDGYVTEMETMGGDIANVGSYVVGGLGLLNGMRRLATSSPRAFRSFARKNPNMSEFAGGVVSGVAVDQWLSNPNHASLTASLVDVPDSAIFGLGEYLQAPDEDDTDLEKRTKLLLGNLPAEIVIGGILGVGSSYISRKYGKSVDELTPEELGEEGLQGLKRTKAELAKGETRLSSNQLVDDAKEQAQVFNQEGVIRGLWQKFTQSRGFNTYAGQDAFEQSAQAARKYRNRAQHISARLQKTINNALKEAQDEDTVSNVLEALTTKADDSRDFGFSTELSDSIAEARGLIDELSIELKKYAPTSEIKKTIDQNLNMYMRRSYKKFEDDNFIPTENTINKAYNYFLRVFQEDDAFRVEEARRVGKNARPKTLKQMEAKARKAVDDVMGAGSLDELTGKSSVKNI